MIPNETNTPDLAKALARSIAQDPLQSAAVLAALAAVAVVHPVAGIASLIAGGALMAYRLRDQPDPFGRGGKERAAMLGRFTLSLGRESGSGRDLILTDDDARQSLLVLGDAGKEKTEFLLGLAEGTIAAGSGAIIVNGEGDIDLFAKVFALATLYGREDDLLVLNMMTGNADVGGNGGHLLSNTLNPFSTGSSDHLTQLVVGLMDDDGSGDGAMWKGRATSWFAALMRYLTWMRDTRDVALHVGTISDHMSLATMVGISDGSIDPDLPPEIRAMSEAYLGSLPGFNPERGVRQAQTTLDHHGHLQMQFMRLLGSLADVYGHIFKVRHGEIDMQDVVLNRRILVVMLPTLAASGGELANLGRIVVSTLKGMMGAGLGNRIESSWGGDVEPRVVNSPSPFLCVLDEVGHYTVEGMALMAAQARSLGFSMVYGSRDVPEMMRLHDREAASIIANTNTKIFMRTESMGTHGIPGWAARAGIGIEGFVDLRKLKAGEMVLVHRSGQILADGRRPTPPNVAAPTTGRVVLRLMHFLGLATPKANDVGGRDAR